MRVLIVSHACATPANQRMFQLAAESNGWDVTLLLPRTWKSEYGTTLRPSLYDGFRAQLHTARVLKSGSVPLHAYVCRMGKILKSLQPEVIYIHNEPYAVSTFQWVLANNRSVQRPIGIYSCQNINKRYPIPFRWAESWVYSKAAFALPITHSVEQVMRAKGFGGTSTIVSIGYDGERFNCEPAEAKARHSGGNRKLVVGYIGRFVAEKGLPTLFAALAKMRSNATLRMIGGGPMERRLKETAKALGIDGRIEWAGVAAQDKMPLAYKSLDLLVLPSETRANWKEQFGRVLVEAMASGTPVVGSDSGEIPNVIAECRGGVVFPEGNAEALAAQLDELCTRHDLRAELAAAGCVAVRVHSLKNIARRFSDTLQAAANKCRRNVSSNHARDPLSPPLG